MLEFSCKIVKMLNKIKDPKWIQERGSGKRGFQFKLYGYKIHSSFGGEIAIN
jgi:hypothetical protein